MRPRLLLLLVAATLTVAAATPIRGQAPAPTRLALAGGMLLDGYAAPPIHHAVVLIEGDRIVRAGPASEVPIPEGYRVIDTSGRTMMPGMIELHAHLVLVGHGNYGTWFPWIESQGRDRTLPEVMAVAARQLLMAGVTSAVDLGAPLAESLAIRGRIDRGELPGPRMSMSGPWLTRNVAIFPPDYQIEVTSAQQAGRETERLIAAGVDVIKAHSGLTREDYDAIATAAHRHGVRVHAHVYAEQDTRNALEAGIDVLSHVGSAGTAPPYSPDLIRDIVNAGRPVVVTAAHRSWVYPDTAAFPERLQDPALRASMPEPMYEEVQRSLENWRALPYFSRTEREMFFRERGLKQFIESGAVMGMGTDSGTPMNFHTEALWREAKAHVDMGMPPERVISALTRVGATILGRQRDLGTIEPGKLADIIVLQGNPLFDITALSHVETVVKGGRVYKEPGR
ncbi:MAG: amidohydrolase family protein [Vicinamibacterales bacterium]